MTDIADTAGFAGANDAADITDVADIADTAGFAGANDAAGIADTQVLIIRAVLQR